MTIDRWGLWNHGGSHSILASSVPLCANVVDTVGVYSPEVFTISSLDDVIDWETSIYRDVLGDTGAVLFVVAG